MKRFWTSLCIILMGAALLGPPPEALAAEKFRFTAGWIFYGRDLAWFTALEKGYYREEGLDVQLIRGSGGGDAAKALATDALEMVALDTSTFLISRSKGSDFRTVGMWFHLAPFSIVTVEGSGINSLKDVEGRTIGTPSADSSWAMFPAVAELNGIDTKKVKQIEVAPAVRDAGLLSGQYDASTNYIASFPLIYQAAAKQGKKLKVFPFINHGLDIYAQGFVVREARLKGNPESVRKFLRAVLRGGAYAMEKPEEGMDALLKHVPTADRKTSREAWDLMVDLWLTPEAGKMGLGYMNEEKWTRTRDILTKGHKLPAVMPVKELYTNQYLEKIVPKQRGPRVFPKVL